eukprot:3785187-Amphidinium_carterae.2
MKPASENKAETPVGGRSLIVQLRPRAIVSYSNPTLRAFRKSTRKRILQYCHLVSPLAPNFSEGRTAKE